MGEGENGIVQLGVKLVNANAIVCCQTWSLLLLANRNDGHP
ncbi:hypothetical protein PC116_g9734 [Phytophthora cactorum]|nr:hypothetical protein PC116_g9734 [Phytophthora cactorum]